MRFELFQPLSYQVMPILTPAYPSMNSSFNVSVQSLAVMKEEFKRALDLVQDILSKGCDDWSSLFEPSDFFSVHQHYLAVEVYTTIEDEEQAWCGFCESRIRKLIESLAYNSALCRLRAFPKKFPLTFANQVALGDGAAATPTTYGVCFFVGFDIDRRQLRSREVNIETSVEFFKHNDLYRWNKRTPTMDVKVTATVWKQLPECVFEDMGGRQVARGIRREYMKKKKEEEKAADATATPAGSGDESHKDLGSQETDDASGEDAPSRKNSESLPNSPNPAAESVDQTTSSTSVSKEEVLSTPVKAKQPAIVSSTPDNAGKRDHTGTAVNGTIVTPEKKSTSVVKVEIGVTTSTTIGTLPIRASVSSSSPAVVAAPTSAPPPPPPASSPRKRRKMKINFGKLG